MIDVKTTITSFFIFNSNLGPKEGEVSKIIIYFQLFTNRNYSKNCNKIYIVLGIKSDIIFPSLTYKP